MTYAGCLLIEGEIAAAAAAAAAAAPTGLWPAAGGGALRVSCGLIGVAGVLGVRIRGIDVAKIGRLKICSISGRLAGSRLSMSAIKLCSCGLYVAGGGVYLPRDIFLARS